MSGETPAQPASQDAGPLAPHRAPWTGSTTPWLIALLGWTALVAGFALDGGAQLDTTGCWVAQTAREMRETGDWLVPRFSGETRMQKSPGAYWAVMLASYVRGTPVDEGSARLPNLVWSVILVATLFWTAGRIAGPRAAIFTGFATASSAFVLSWSHRGSSDFGLATCLAVSLCSLWAACSAEPPGPRRVALLLLGYFAAGVAMLYKMPMPLPCVGAPAFFYVLLRGRWRVLASCWHVVGLVHFVLPWLPWAITVARHESAELAKWKVEYWDCFTGDLPNVEAQKQWFFYLYYLVPPLVYALPYTLSLPPAVVRAFRRQPGVDRDGQLFMLIWFLSLLAFFTAAVGKEDRYFLPALPPLFVLLGIELSRLFAPRSSPLSSKARLAIIGVWIALPAGCAAGLIGVHKWQAHTGLFTWAQLWPAYVATVAVLCIGGVLAGWFYWKRRPGRSFAALVATSWATFAVAWVQLFPLVGSELPFRDFAEQLRNLTPTQQAALRQIGHQDPRVIWHSDVRFPRIIDQLDLLERQGGQRSLEREERIVFDQMIDDLEGDDLVLYVIVRSRYVQFLAQGPQVLAETGRAMPATHLWLQTRVGPKHKQYIVFGNHQPPWPEPALSPPSEKLPAVPVDDTSAPPEPTPASVEG